MEEVLISKQIEKLPNQAEKYLSCVMQGLNPSVTRVKNLFKNRKVCLTISGKFQVKKADNGQDNGLFGC